MDTPSWASNRAKYMRARETVKSGVEEEVIQEYIRLGGFVIVGQYRNKAEIAAGEVVTEPAPVAEVVAPVKKTRKTTKK